MELNTPLGSCGPDASRSLAYAAFASALEYPDAEMLEAIRSGTVADALRQLLQGIDSDLIADIDWDSLHDAGADDDVLQVEYTRLFDAGPDGPACPLNGGAYEGAAMATMEEVVRFYRLFGVRLPDDVQSEPDRLTIELEFLHYLVYQEVRLSVLGEEVVGLQRGQRDFIARHPGHWVPLMHARLNERAAPSFYRELTRVLGRFLRQQQERLDRQLGEPTRLTLPY